MKKTFFVLLSFVALFTASSAHAQFRSLPGVVTDYFKAKYPNAKSVTWSDKVSAFQAVFLLDTVHMIARYDKDGKWLQSTKRISVDGLPVEVKDGLSKSKYADPEWTVRSVTVKFLPGDVTQYQILVAKNDISKRNLLFSVNGRLLSDSNTL